MKVAVSSLSRYTHVAEFIDAAQVLNGRHEVRYFLGPTYAAAVKLLESRGIGHTRLLPSAQVDVTTALGTAAGAKSVFALFTDYFLRHAEMVLPNLLDALERWQPDLVLSHLRDYAGITAAEILGIPVVSFGSHGPPHREEPLDPPFGAGIARGAPERELGLMWRLQHHFDERVDAVYNKRLRQPYGLLAIRGTSTYHSRTLTLLSMIPALANRNTPEPPYIRYVGPLFSQRNRSGTPDESALLERISNMPGPRVLLSLGTTYVKPVLESCLAALEHFPGTLIASLGGDAHTRISASRRARSNLIYQPFFTNIGRVLELSDVVVTVAAGKSVMDALACGKPLVCLPQQGEQREIALALRDCGAAEVPCSRKWADDDFANAVERVASEPCYADAAGRLQQQVRQMGGAAFAADLVETVVTRPVSLHNDIAGNTAC